jgi:hypothetical protein
VTSLDLEAVPDVVRDAAIEHTVGCMAAAVGLGEEPAAATVFTAQGGEHEATAVGCDRGLPASSAAMVNALCERKLELGVIVQPTGERENVLKVKPPLCIDAPDADAFVRALDRVLSEGW